MVDTAPRVLRRRATTASAALLGPDDIVEVRAASLAVPSPLGGTVMRCPRIRRYDSLPAQPELPIEGRRGGHAPEAPSRERLPERYEVLQPIGSGSYGSVCVARVRGTEQLVAVKRVPNVFRDLRICKRLLREIAILARLEHPGVVRLGEVAPVQDVGNFNELFIVMELADSDLGRLLAAEVALTHEHTTMLMYNLVAGVGYLHSAGIIHRDLKPANCLVNKDCTVKVCDFGLSRTDPSRTAEVRSGPPILQRRLTTHVVTRWYRAPELILLQEDYTGAVDVWSLGCIYGELLGMHEGTRPSDRRPLFTGGSCYPLSPAGEHPAQGDRRSADPSDQLSVIFDVLGTPSVEAIGFVSSSEALAYLRSFPAQEGSGLRQCFQPEICCGEAFEVLESSLKFDPRTRLGARELMAMRIFHSVRDPAMEAEAPGPVHLDFEKAPLEELRLRSYFVQEISSLQRARLATLAGA